MTATRTEAVVRGRNGSAIIDLSGDIDGSAEAELERAYAEAVGESSESIVLNFGGVGYINSTGIALLVSLMANARKDGRAMSACALSDHYREIFEITRLTDFMPVFADEEAAVAGR